MARSFISWTLLCAIVAVGVALFGCSKGDDNAPGTVGTSLLFDDASPDARAALATPVNLRLTDVNFAQWERAQEFLDALPASALPAGSGGGAQSGSPIDRAVARLESSPRARTAIERTGLSVRDFVLETIALAQATEASASGKLVGTSSVAAENFRFVQRYGSRILRDRQQPLARARPEEDYLPSDTAAQDEGAMATDDDAQREAERRDLDSAAASERAEPDSQAHRDAGRLPVPEPARDTVRETVPPR